MKIFIVTEHFYYENTQMYCDKKRIAIETSGRIGSVALGIGEKVVASAEFSGDQQHAEELLLVMRALCEKVDWRPEEVEAIYVSGGPGSFTGLRVGITVCKTFAFSTNAKIVRVPSMDVMVLNVKTAIENGESVAPSIGVIMDAKRKQVYGAIYQLCDNSGLDNGLVSGFKEIAPAQVIAPSALLALSSGELTILGEGLRWHSASFQNNHLVNCLPEKYWQPYAVNVLKCGLLRERAGLYDDFVQLAPIYLRRPEAEEQWEKRQK